MKNTKITIALLVLVLLGYACSGPSSTQESAQSEPEQAQSLTPAVCVWDNISLRKAPNGDGKWMTSISVGESVSTKGGIVSDSVGKRDYILVVLADSTTGWALSDFIINDGKASTFKDALTDVYKRPDLLTKSDKQFKVFDIVAATKEQEDWVEVTGKIAGANTLTSGWVRKQNLIQGDVDIAVAKYALKALEEKDADKKKSGLTELASNADLRSSVMMDQVDQLLLEMSETAVVEESTEVE